MLGRRRLIVALRAALAVALAIAVFGSWTGSGQAQSPDLLARCKNWRVSAGKRQLDRPSEDLCREVAARALTVREACIAVAEKLAGVPGGVVSCTSWARREVGDLTRFPDVPDDVWKAYVHNEVLRAALERRLGPDWEQPQVQKELEAAGFACGMSRNFPSRHVHGEFEKPKLMCTARVSRIDTSWAQGGGVRYLWVEVQFDEHAERRRWRQLVVHVHSDGYTRF
jgi:hypothetical protein